jgi:2-methylisocitrate lyase-like PEP mutase family enzyme
MAAMATQTDKAARFLDLHRRERPLLMPNPWDAGSAKVLASLGFDALATTSAGYAGTLGRHDGKVSRDEAIAHGATIVDAVDVPVSADLENLFADKPDDVRANAVLAVGAGLAGFSIEDFTGDMDNAIYDAGLARDRVTAAAEAAHGGPAHVVLTGRCENHIRGINDLADTITRLQAYQEAGADVLYAPGVSGIDDIRSIVASVDRPINVLALPGAPTVDELAAAGVGRVSVGSAFALVAMGALAQAASELKEKGTYDFWTVAGQGMLATMPAYT